MDQQEVCGYVLRADRKSTCMLPRSVGIFYGLTGSLRVCYRNDDILLCYADSLSEDTNFGFVSHF